MPLISRWLVAGGGELAVSTTHHPTAGRPKKPLVNFSHFLGLEKPSRMDSSRAGLTKTGEIGGLRRETGRLVRPGVGRTGNGSPPPSPHTALGRAGATDSLVTSRVLPIDAAIRCGSGPVKADELRNGAGLDTGRVVHRQPLPLATAEEVGQPVFGAFFCLAFGDA